MTYLPFWLPLALAGFPPWMILTQQAISLIAGEQEQVRYGLTTNIETHKPTEVAFHEYKAIARDVRTAHVARALGLHAAPPRLGAAGRLTAPRPDPREHRGAARAEGIACGSIGQAAPAPRGDTGLSTPRQRITLALRNGSVTLWA